MTFWNRLEKALIENNISEAELSRKIGITQASINGWKTKGAIPRADIAIKAANIVGYDLEYLINGLEEPKKIAHQNSFYIPILNQKASAGKGHINFDDSIVGYIPAPPKLKSYGTNLVCLFVTGDSMEPTLYDNDMVICDSNGYDNGEGLYIVNYHGNTFVKRLQIGKGEFLLKSDNPHYETFNEPFESDDIKIIGKVRYVFKQL